MPDSINLMDTEAIHLPLSAQELDRIGGFLVQATNPGALSLEGMDGLFCALIAGPVWVTPGEYLPLLWDGALPDDLVRFNLAHVNAMIRLLQRHWNSTRAELDLGGLHTPRFVSAAADAVPGRVWAQGFMRGVRFAQTGWNELLQADNTSELYRIPRLAQETARPSGQNARSRASATELIPWLARAIADAYQYFRDRRLAERLMVELTAGGASSKSLDLPS